MDQLVQNSRNDNPMNSYEDKNEIALGGNLVRDQSVYSLQDEISLKYVQKDQDVQLHQENETTVIDEYRKMVDQLVLEIEEERNNMKIIHDFNKDISNKFNRLNKETKEAE